MKSLRCTREMISLKSTPGWALNRISAVYVFVLFLEINVPHFESMISTPSKLRMASSAISLMYAAGYSGDTLLRPLARTLRQYVFRRSFSVLMIPSLMEVKRLRLEYDVCVSISRSISSLAVSSNKEEQHQCRPDKD